MYPATAKLVAQSLPPALRNTLAGLAGSPSGIAETAIQFVPFDQREPLLNHGLAEKGRLLESGHYSLRLLGDFFVVAQEAANLSEEVAAQATEPA